MTVGSKEFYEIIMMFEKDVPYGRKDKEQTSEWPKGRVYQNGEMNNLFLIYRKGYAFGRVN